ncbi:hypothetical protein A3H78_01340 [Candidatus Roizmanbacteria bacterium RIFCSPLOWO2_02_FULL_36_11]|uniref:Glycosyltransferase 2-like domain-containing protein n=1 Tax=Candidatus Roizmanbacteria bacterium RIFCSPLOWO2_02_FULL_36_11 TaxID=1802071 RepID=A0A1F7JFB0_9BACT|nr:MAG: hypothetical protein A3H78_01340 [Candidatus Roizmanbacteria bacterium RIFCSPLOWO2_02_FULL_36_11]
MKITLVIPCYNEELNIQKGVLDKIGNFTDSNVDIVEVIISDDGSTDSTKNIIKNKYLRQFSKFKLLENSHCGKAFTLISAIKAAVGDYIIFSDMDLATPLEEAEKLINEAKKGSKIVIGSRNNSRKGAPILRKVMAKGFILVRDVLIGLQGIKDSQCGFKLFDRKLALTIIDQLVVFKKERNIDGSSVSAGFDLEFLFVSGKLGHKIKEVPVIWRHVETKNVNFLSDSIETLRDIMKIKYNDLTKKYSFRK